MKKNPMTALAAFSLLMTPLTYAHAEQVFTITGQIDSTNGFSGVNVGDTYTSVFTIHDNLVSDSNDPIFNAYVSNPSYRTGNVEVTETFGSYTITQDFSEQNSYNIVSALHINTPQDYYDVLSGSTAEASGSGISHGYGHFDLATNHTPGQNVLSSIYPIIAGPGLNDLSYWNNNIFNFSGQNSDGSFGNLSGHLTSINTVSSTSTPEPAPMATLGLGGIALCALALRARKRRSATV